MYEMPGRAYGYYGYGGPQVGVTVWGEP
jgi:hypothetical protein